MYVWKCYTGKTTLQEGQDDFYKHSI